MQHNRDRRRTKLYAISVKKVKESNTQIVLTGFLTINGKFGPHLVNKETALFIDTYESAVRFANLHLKELRKDSGWFWEYCIEDLPAAHSKYIQIAQLHRNHLINQLTVTLKKEVTSVEPVEIEAPEVEIEVILPKVKRPRKKRVVIQHAFAIQVADGNVPAQFIGYLNLDFSVKSLMLSKSTAVFLDRTLAERFITVAQTRISPELGYELSIETIEKNIEKAKVLAKFALPAINRLMAGNSSLYAFNIEVTGASPRNLPDNLAPLKNFKSRESERYYLCTNLQITDQSYRRAYFDSEQIAKAFLAHVRPFLKMAYRGVKFKIMEVELEPTQYQWVEDAMLRVKNTLLTRVKPPKEPKPPRITNKKTESSALQDYYVVAIGDEEERYFQYIDDDDSIITNSLDMARWYDTDSAAIEEAQQIYDRYNVTARAVLMHRELDQSLAPIEQDHQFKLWLWQQEQLGSIEIANETQRD